MKGFPTPTAQGGLPAPIPADGERRPVPFALALGAILVLAAAIRVWHVMALRNLPLFDHLIIDSRLYDLWARRIASGDWLGGDRPFYMDPLYPYVLAIAYRIFGHDLLAVRLIQVALGVGTCGLVGVLGRRLGGARVGLVAALLVALYQPLVFEEAEIEKTALGIFLVTASLVLGTGASTASRWGSGISLGLATLVRGNLLLLAPLGAILFLLERRGPHGKRSALAAVAFATGFLIALAPVLWRNHRVSHQWVLTTSQLGQNAYTGNNPSNPTGAYVPVPFVRPLPEHEEPDFRSKAEALTGRKLTAGEVSSFWLGESIRHVAEQPSFAARVFANKMALTVADLEIPDGWSVYFVRRFSPALNWAFLSMAWLLPLSVVGAVVFVRSNHVTRLLVGYVITYSASIVAFFVFSRYRIYLAPALAVLAASGGFWVFDMLRARRWGSVAGAMVTVGVVAWVSVAAARLPGLNRDAFVHNYAHLAEIYQDRGDFGRAEALLQEGLRLQPDSVPILYAAGSLRLRLGDPASAVSLLEKAVRSDPAYHDVLYVLGTAHESLNHPEQAKQYYWRQLDRTPGHKAASVRLRRLLGAPRANGGTDGVRPPE